jgi:hypothetical protein
MRKIASKALWSFFLLLIIVPMLLIAATPNLHEVFLLGEGSKYTYRYRYEYRYADVVFFQNTIDSGIVRYTVLDSAMLNDTTARWNVMESFELLRQYSYYSGRDTSYWIIDSNVIALDEVVTGYHELNCSSLVWQFPIPHLYDPGYDHIFRYSDSVNVVLYMSEGSGMGCPWRYDTLWFSSDSSFCRQSSRLGHFCNITGYGKSISMQIISSPLTSVRQEKIFPERQQLSRNYPNPFNSTTTIAYDLPKRGRVSLSVYDLLGRCVRVLVDAVQEGGAHTKVFDASGLASGVYFYRLQSQSEIKIGKMLFQK